MTTIAKTIKELRIRKEFTQAEIAESLGLARASYIAIEQGKRGLSLSEATELARMLGVTVEDLSNGMLPMYEKYKQMILFILGLVSGDGKLPKTKLAKLLYLSDFSWFYYHLESMSGMAYRKIQFGPVPDQFFRAIDEFENEGLIDVDRKTAEGKNMLLVSLSRVGKREKITELSPEEKNLIKKIEKKWRDKSAREIVAFTHSQIPYEFAFDGDIISYALITQEEPDYVF